MSDSEDDFIISSDEEMPTPKKKTPVKKPIKENKENGKSKNKKAQDIDTTLTEEDRNVFTNIDNKGKKTAIEDIYQKKSQLEHILLRPDTYIGSVEYTDKAPMWVFDPEANKLVYKDISYVPGLYKIFDEILVNAADNKQRDPKMSLIKIDIDKARNQISVYNNGKGIPVVMHKVEKVYVPELIFGTLLTSSNYDDSEKKVTGGRNGYGAKLCNIFSTEFTLETSSKEYKKAFKQKWIDNMTKDEDPTIVSSTGEDFTKVTFKPDLAKFKMAELDDDIIHLMMRRAYDVAGSTKGVKVFLNGKLVPVQGFKQYVELYTKENVSEDAKVVYENVNNRWEVALTVSENGFKQVSFVNSIATTKGGRHVDYVADQMVAKMIDVIKKKVGSKSTVNVKPFQVKNHMWVFVNCLIENPTFDSQTKETMTLQSKSFGSKCDLSETFSKGAHKCGVVDAVLSWVRFKQQEDLNKKCSSKKTSKLKGIPKLEDANDAGTKNSRFCTLILTEGDSAKTLAVSGLAVVGRDRYGVFPLRGKLLNVREGNHKQVVENAEINALIKIIGLQYKKNYQTDEDFNSLRYGSIMIMADQDQDGSHIKGLVINFIHNNWPSLIKRNFVEQFITPIVKASRGKEELSFFSLPEYREWKNNAPNSDRYRIKYYKGLGTSTSKEAKEYFSDMVRHRIKFKYGGEKDDEAVNMAFSKTKIQERKDWLTKWMDQKKERRTQGLEEEYLYNKDTRSVTYNEFINKELVLFSNTDNERSIPCLVDGFKPGQRKVMFSCFKRADKREVKVAQLAGAVGELSAYHHGEQSLMGTIVNLAQDYVGSNNLNLLLPIGQFGTRLQGGKDSASPRYIFTKLNPVTRHVFPVADDNVLRFLFEDNQKIEPEWYCPIIPMVLVNGASGIGTGWSTNIPNYCPRQVAENIRRLIRGQEQKTLMPWFKGFRGKITQLDAQHFACYGIVSRLDDDTVEITELPIKKWTQEYKESVLEPMMEGYDGGKDKAKGKKKDKDGEKTEKIPAIISDFKEYHTDTTVRFVVKFASGQLRKAEQAGIYKVLKLYQTISNTSMVLFDANGCLRTFKTPEDICVEFFEARKAKYIERKNFLEGMLKAQSDRLSNQARFILAKISGEIVMENKKKVAIIEQLIKHKFDPDPVKKWKDDQKKKLAELYGEDEEVNENAGEDDDDGKEQSAEQKKEAETDRKMSAYDYLVGMALIKLSEEEKNKMLKESEERLRELKTLQSKSWADLWTEDLDNFEEELQKQEDKEKADIESAMKKKAVELGAKGSKKSRVAVEVLPSKDGEYMEPEMDTELRAKYAPKKERVKKEPVEKKEKPPKKEGSDIKKFLSSPKPKKDEWNSDQSSDEEDFEERYISDENDNIDDDVEEVMPTKKSNRSARNIEDSIESTDVTPVKQPKKKQVIESDDEEIKEIIEVPRQQKKAPAKEKPAPKKKFDYESDEDQPAKNKKKASPEVFEIPSDSDDELLIPGKKESPKKKKAEPKEVKPKAEPKPKAAPKPKAEKKAPPAKKMTDFFNKKKKKGGDSDSEELIYDEDESMDVETTPPKPRAASKRAKAKTNYNINASDSEDDIPKKKKKKAVSSDEESDYE